MKFETRKAAQFTHGGDRTTERRRLGLCARVDRGAVGSAAGPERTRVPLCQVLHVSVVCPTWGLSLKAHLPVAASFAAPFSPVSVHLVIDPDDDHLAVGQQITLDHLAERESMQHQAKDLRVVHRRNMPSAAASTSRSSSNTLIRSAEYRAMR